MSLDIYLTAVRPQDVYSGNITHNLGLMAEKAGLYQVLWCPMDLPQPWWRKKPLAKDLIKPLSAGLARLEADPDYFKQYNPQNGWGDYDGLVKFVKDYLYHCKTYPDATIRVWK